MTDLDTLNILTVGTRLANLARRAAAAATPDASSTSVTEVDSGRAALAMLRVVPFDLVAVGSDLADMASQDFARTLRRAKPWQHWVRVNDGEPDAASSSSSSSEEVVARTLGALAVFDGAPDDWPQIVALAQQVRRRDPARRVPGLRIDRTVEAATPSAAAG